MTPLIGQFLGIEADKPTATGRVYPKSVLASLVCQARQDKTDIPGFYGNLTDAWQPPSVDTCAFTARNVRLERERLVCDVAVVDTPAGRKLRKDLAAKKNVPFTLAVTASLRRDAEGREVIGDDVKLCGVSAVLVDGQ